MSEQLELFPKIKSVGWMIFTPAGDPYRPSSGHLVTTSRPARVYPTENRAKAYAPKGHFVQEVFRSIP